MDLTNEPPPSANAHAPAAEILRAYIVENETRLLQVIRSYVMRWDAMAGQSVGAAASEILSELTVQVLTKPDRFDPTRQPGAWLLGIAKNLVHQRRQKMERTQLYEEFASTPSDNDEAEVDIFDRLAKHAWQRDQVDETSAKLDELLAQSPPEDRYLLQRVDLQGWDYATLANEFHVAETTLRKRHFRAIQRLRRLANQEGGQQS